MRSDEELKTIAKDIKGNLIFRSAYVSLGDQSLMSMIFMPLALMGPKESKQIVKDLKSGKVAEFYEYYDKAGPRAINGYPIFVSFYTLGRDEVEKVNEYIKRLKTVEEAVLAPTPSVPAKPERKRSSKRPEPSGRKRST